MIRVTVLNKVAPMSKREDQMNMVLIELGDARIDRETALQQLLDLGIHPAVAEDEIAISLGEKNFLNAQARDDPRGFITSIYLEELAAGRMDRAKALGVLRSLEM